MDTRPVNRGGRNHLTGDDDRADRVTSFHPGTANPGTANPGTANLGPRDPGALDAGARDVGGAGREAMATVRPSGHAGGRPSMAYHHINLARW
jgi:hypothetical protein